MSENSVVFLFETTLRRLPRQHEIHSKAETAGTVKRIFFEPHKYQAVIEYSTNIEALASIQILNKSKFTDYGTITVKKMFPELDQQTEQKSNPSLPKIYCYTRLTKRQTFESKSCRTPFALKISGIDKNMDSVGMQKYISDSADCVFASCHYEDGAGKGLLCFSTRMDMINGYNALCGIKIRGSAVHVEYEDESLANIKKNCSRTRAASPVPKQILS